MNALARPLAALNAFGEASQAERYRKAADEKQARAEADTERDRANRTADAERDRLLLRKLSGCCGRTKAEVKLSP